MYHTYIYIYLLFLSSIDPWLTDYLRTRCPPSCINDHNVRSLHSHILGRSGTENMSVLLQDVKLRNVYIHDMTWQDRTWHDICVPVPSPQANTLKPLSWLLSSFGCSVSRFMNDSYSMSVYQTFASSYRSYLKSYILHLGQVCHSGEKNHSLHTTGDHWGSPINPRNPDLHRLNRTLTWGGRKRRLRLGCDEQLGFIWVNFKGSRNSMISKPLLRSSILFNPLDTHRGL